MSEWKTIDSAPTDGTHILLTKEELKTAYEYLRAKYDIVLEPKTNDKE